MSALSPPIPARLVRADGQPLVRIAVLAVVLDGYPHALCRHVDAGEGRDAGDVCRWGLASVAPHPMPANWRGWRHAAAEGRADG